MGGPVGLGWRKDGEISMVSGHSSDLRKLCDPRVLSGDVEAWERLMEVFAEDGEAESRAPEPEGYGLLFVDFDTKSVFNMQWASDPFNMNLMGLAQERKRVERQPHLKKDYFSEEERLRAAFELGWAGRTEFSRGGTTFFKEPEDGGARNVEEAVELSRSAANPLGVVVGMIKGAVPEAVELRHEGWDLRTFVESPEGISNMVYEMACAGLFDDGLPMEWDVRYEEQVDLEGEEALEGGPSAVVAMVKAENERDDFSETAREPKVGKGKPRI